MKVYMLEIEHKPACHVVWGAMKKMEAASLEIAEMYGRLFAKEWDGVLVSVRETEQK